MLNSLVLCWVFISAVSLFATFMLYIRGDALSAMVLLWMLVSSLWVTFSNNEADTRKKHKDTYVP